MPARHLQCIPSCLFLLCILIVRSQHGVPGSKMCRDQAGHIHCCPISEGQLHWNFERAAPWANKSDDLWLTLLQDTVQQVQQHGTAHLAIRGLGRLGTP